MCIIHSFSFITRHAYLRVDVCKKYEKESVCYVFSMIMYKRLIVFVVNKMPERNKTSDMQVKYCMINVTNSSWILQPMSNNCIRALFI